MNPPPEFELDFVVTRGATRLHIELCSTDRRIAIVGPSGAGKSTALEAIAGVLGAVVGRVVFRGVTWQGDHQIAVPTERRRIAWVPQDGLLFPHLDVRHNLAFGGASGRDVREMADALELGSLLDRRPWKLSGGERQRVALARALLAPHDLVLLDEPLSALDRDRRDRVAELIVDRCEKSKASLVLVSHDTDDVTRLAQSVYVLDANGALAPAASTPGGA